ncbi:uncharacterized protein PITG_06280 [Phytophthora infestans T30-4]|uniref:Hexosyltransferase n=1 Tax=Phytophthora infestans (strain T30-4) TaxID=403677 RepID=D0N4H9_PHYIT|nr:uncharacterized protein PITG_06280 [Phytophthora infestans T30-4]EEY69787.1 conserved hypothetical protein [Phytophthora infestans T30-4]|eukprot:XP_002998434.1 conserved hypothetical protein [Phytophthora infestans T30-4]
MIADDNIYLRADRLRSELSKEDRPQRLYIGQMRGALHDYNVPKELYPLDTYPPFAFGQHYLLSMDCARFIAKNSERLRGLDRVDDISVALWLLAIQVHVCHHLDFDRFMPI